MIKFHRHNFYPKRNSILNKNVKSIIKNTIIDHRINNSFKIKDVSSLNNIKNNSLLFINKSSFDINNIENLCIITNDIKIFQNNLFDNIFLVKHLGISYNLLINHMYFHEDSLEYSDDFIKTNNYLLSNHSKVHKSSKIFNNCVIGRGVEIGKNCIIKNNVVIKNAIIGDNVTIGDNTVIGSTGFGFSLDFMGSHNINPQIGITYIDNNVHIGSGCTIDRGKIDITYIGKNSMIDNLVHIAHNVNIMENACIAAQTGISGSVNIGKNLIVGGQSGFAGHIKIANNVLVAGRSGVTKNVTDNSSIAGFPAIDIKKWKKSIIKSRK